MSENDFDDFCDKCIRRSKFIHCRRCDDCHDHNMFVYCELCKICVNPYNDKDSIAHARRHAARERHSSQERTCRTKSASWP